MGILNTRRAVAILAALLPLAALLSSAARPAAPTEYELKAAFLFNFTQFVDWPPSSFEDAASPIVIGVLGADPFGEALDEVVRGEIVNGRPLALQRYASIEEIDTCHVLFIARSERNRLGKILDVLQGRSILTVGDFRGFAFRGGVIGLVRAGNRIQLHVNLDAAEEANLMISSKLLRPARIVTRSG